MPTYLQMPFRDAETKRCQGCVLMHLEEDGGKQILIISPNPSSTYLYQVNETEMLRQLVAQIIAFAEKNPIDAIGIPKHAHIRTNRTGGEFERAINDAIRTIGREHVFAQARRFSYEPKYEVDGVDIVWAKDLDAFPKTALKIEKQNVEQL
jgi:hypothetical protein